MATFYTDENVSSLLNDALRAFGHTVFATFDEGRSSATDGSQLLFAAEREWIILMHNRADFILLQDAWHLWTRAWRVEPEHTGIVVVEPTNASRYPEIAALVNDLCQQHALPNALFAWKRTTGWLRNPRR